MAIQIGQRFRFKRSLGFIAEVVNVRNANSFSVKIVQDLGWGRYPGYIYEDEDLTNTNSWEYLPGQDAPTI